MATRGSFWLRGKKGKLAGTTVYTSKGRTIQREIVAVSNPQTRAQMTQRVKWPNLVNTYKLLKSIMKYAFESKKGAQSDYNALMSVNASATKVPYITKSMARQGIVIPFGYQITMGSLGTFGAAIDEESDALITNIVTGSLQNITGDTTVGQLATAVLAANPQLREGMQVSFIVVSADGDPTGVDGPYFSSLVKCEFILDKASTEKVNDFAGAITLSVNSGALCAVLNNGFANAYACIVSDTRNGKTSVSSERLLLSSNAAMQAELFTSEEFLNAAIDSYGVQEVAFLNSNEAKKS